MSVDNGSDLPICLFDINIIQKKALLKGDAMEWTEQGIG